MRAADLLDGGGEHVVARERGAGGAGRLREREQQVLGGDVLVAQLAGLSLGGAQDVEQLAGVAGLARAGGDRREVVEGGVDDAADLLRRGADLAQDGRDHAVVLLEQHGEQVLGLDLRVAPRGSKADRGLEGLL